MQAALDSAGEAATVVQGPKLAATVAMGSETLQQTMQQTQVQEPAQAATGGRAVDFDVTSNFASETVQINLDAGDPLSEAEFHRAYGLYDEAALLLKQLRSAGYQGTFVAADGVKDDGFIKAAGSAAEGAIITCPCLPPDKAAEFSGAFEKAYGSPPATYSAEAYDAANVFLAGIAAGKTSSEDMNAFIKSYDQPGVTKQIQFDEKGEPAHVSVWAYKVEGGKIVPDQEVK